MIIAVIFLVKNQSVDRTQSGNNQTAETQLDQYLEKGKPAFVFFHSNNCQSCIDMIAIVEYVYPEFKDNIAMVDVNVYDPANQNLIQRAKVSSIPTQVFIDHTGQGKIIMGVMTADDLRTQLLTLAEALQ